MQHIHILIFQVVMVDTDHTRWTTDNIRGVALSSPQLSYIKTHLPFLLISFTVDHSGKVNCNCINLQAKHYAPREINKHIRHSFFIQSSLVNCCKVVTSVILHIHYYVLL